MAESPARHCFVTIGATADFQALLTAVLRQSFLEALVSSGYKSLRIQYGKGGSGIYQSCADNPTKPSGLSLSGFDFNPKGLDAEMIAARDSQGCVISHAGSGTILDGLRLGVPLVVVPNTLLLHNHQEELAKQLASMQYVVNGRLDTLEESIPQVEQMRKQMKEWPPIQSRGKGLASVMDNEMGWVD